MFHVATCPKCKDRPRHVSRTGRVDSYCQACRRAYANYWHRADRQKNGPRHARLLPEQRRKAICRSYTKVLVSRGHLDRGRCRDCGSDEAEAHHPDYSDPRTVLWLCRPCHLALHAQVG